MESSLHHIKIIEQSRARMVTSQSAQGPRILISRWPTIPILLCGFHPHGPPLAQMAGAGAGAIASAHQTGRKLSGVGWVEKGRPP